jgi:hypothetical protein
MTNSPTIVVVAFNRVASLNRLLSSLSVSRIDSGTRLIISIDYSGDDSVERSANLFDWVYGEKIVTTHAKNLGLRQHVIKCGDLTSIYGSIILLEDDLVVSPMFYQYSKHALNFYEKDSRVGGISLYCHKFNVNSLLPFEPLYDGYDNFWLQFASSWGQAWTARQWRDFKVWYETDQNGLNDTDRIPANVVNWPESSWLKYFIKYLVVKDRYFIYPRDSLSTNFSDIGTNISRKDYTYQVSLALDKQHYKFSSIVESTSVYDVFFEITPKILKRLNKSLSNIDFDVDLYGTKRMNDITAPYLLSSKAVDGNTLMSFARELRPHDQNILSNFVTNKNAIFHLAPSRHFDPKISHHAKKSENDYYFYVPSFKRLVGILVAKIKYRIRAIILTK